MGRRKTKKKKGRTVVKLLSMAGTGYFYVTTKNPRRTQHKIKLRKYDPIVNQHVVFEERKVNAKGNKLFHTMTNTSLSSYKHPITIIPKMPLFSNATISRNCLLPYLKRCVRLI